MMKSFRSLKFLRVGSVDWSRFEKKCDAGRNLYSIVGYTTVYGFYAYPDKLRPRLSQLLILPQFQRKGHGGE